MQACPAEAGRVMSAPQAQQERGGQLQQARDWRRGDLQRVGGDSASGRQLPIPSVARVPVADWLICTALLSLERSACGAGPIVNGNRILPSSEAHCLHIT